MQSDQGFVHSALPLALGQGSGHGALMAYVPCFIASPVFMDWICFLVCLMFVGCGSLLGVRLLLFMFCPLRPLSIVCLAGGRVRCCE
jgi:hypothetical protein